MALKLTATCVFLALGIALAWLLGWPGGALGSLLLGSAVAGGLYVLFVVVTLATLYLHARWYC